MKAYQRLHTLKDPNQFSGWLYVITANLCATWLRKKRIQTQPLEDTETTIIQEDAYSQHVDVTTGDAIAVLDGPTKSVNMLAFSPDGTMLVSAATDGTILLWDWNEVLTGSSKSE